MLNRHSYLATACLILTALLWTGCDQADVLSERTPEKNVQQETARLASTDAGCSEAEAVDWSKLSSDFKERVEALRNKPGKTPAEIKQMIETARKKRGKVSKEIPLELDKKLHALHEKFGNCLRGERAKAYYEARQELYEEYGTDWMRGDLYSARSQATTSDQRGGAGPDAQSRRMGYYGGGGSADIRAYWSFWQQSDVGDYDAATWSDEPEYCEVHGLFKMNGATVGSEYDGGMYNAHVGRTASKRDVGNFKTTIFELISVHANDEDAWEDEVWAYA